MQRKAGLGRLRSILYRAEIGSSGSIVLKNSLHAIFEAVMGDFRKVFLL
jgi:hypothetical protein